MTAVQHCDRNAPSPHRSSSSLDAIYFFFSLATVISTAVPGAEVVSAGADWERTLPFFLRLFFDFLSFFLVTVEVQIRRSELALGIRQLQALQVGHLAELDRRLEQELVLCVGQEIGRGAVRGLTAEFVGEQALRQAVRHRLASVGLHHQR